MRGTNLASGQHRPPRIIPAVGQVPEYLAEASRNDCWGIFQEEEAGSYQIGDSEDFPVKAGAFAVDSCASAGC